MFFIRDVVGVAMQMKKHIYIYTNLNKTKNHFPLFCPHNFSKIAFIGLLETNILLESGSPRHAIVYIPTADFGQNLRETQAKAGDLKPFAQRYFLIS